METILLALQARVLLWVGMMYIIIGLWLGTDPAALAWRAPAAAVGAMIVAGWLLRQVAAVIEERAAADMAERQLAAEKAEDAAQTAAKAAGPPAAQAARNTLQTMHAAPARAARPGR